MTKRIKIAVKDANILIDLDVAGLFSKSTAAAKLVTLLEDGTYLPRQECEKRLKQWQQ